MAHRVSLATREYTMKCRSYRNRWKTKKTMERLYRLVQVQALAEQGCDNAGCRGQSPRSQRVPDEVAQQRTAHVSRSLQPPLAWAVVSRILVEASPKRRVLNNAVHSHSPTSRMPAFGRAAEDYIEATGRSCRPYGVRQRAPAL